MDIFNTDRRNKFFIVNESQPREHYEESFVFMNEAEYEFFEERAAIMEFESGLTCEEAERLAYQRIVQNREFYAQAS